MANMRIVGMNAQAMFIQKEIKDVKFVYYTKDGERHEKVIDKEDRDERLKFIEWLETNKNVVKWY